MQAVTKNSTERTPHAYATQENSTDPADGSTSPVDLATLYAQRPRGISERKAWLSALPKPAARGWLHCINTPLSLINSILLIMFAGSAGLKWACAAFGLCALILFGNSATYHLGHWSQRTHNVLRRIDHSNIFLLIAGTYTPLSVGVLSPTHRNLVLAIVWLGAAAGIILSVAWNTAPRWLYVPLYILLGWVALWFLPEFWRDGGPACVWLLLVGGLGYTIGALCYAFRWPNPWPAVWGFHEFFHLGTIVGYWSHSAAIWVGLATIGALAL